VPREPALHLLTLALVVTAGCIGTPLGSDASPTDGRATGTPLPGSPVDFPEGPKDRPDRPATLNESSVREHVRTFEYRLAYNSLWYGEGTDVTLDCTVESVSETPYGYTAVVSCTGYSETQGTAASTATQTVLHADWETQTYRYRMSGNATARADAER
jgi:hypothetical protein